MKLGIQIGLAIAIIALGYFVYDSVNSKITFEKETKRRSDIVVERLKDIRTVQMAYKSTKGSYASSFDSLVDFIQNGKISVIKQVGDFDDSVAVAQGLVTRDTTFINVIDTLFSKTYLQNHLWPFYIDSLPYVPFSDKEKFKIDAGEIEKNKVKVQVFEVFASFGQIYKGLPIEDHNIKVGEGLKVGSMTEPSTNGNWE